MILRLRRSARSRPTRRNPLLFPWRNATERGALFHPGYNLEELEFLRLHTPSGGVFVDVGANVGTFAMVLARHVGANDRLLPGCNGFALAPRDCDRASVAR
jgi:hypothetical protein